MLPLGHVQVVDIWLVIDEPARDGPLERWPAESINCVGSRQEADRQEGGDSGLELALVDISFHQLLLLFLVLLVFF